MIKEEMLKRGVLYLRVSSTEQASNYSLENQEEYCTRKATEEGYQIVKRFIDTMSGKTIERPSFQELLSFCTNKKNNIQAIFVYKLDRLGRNNRDWQNLAYFFAKHGITLISATEVNGSGPEVKFLRDVLAAAAEFDNSVKAFRVKDGMRKRFLKGLLWNQSHPGYKKQLVNGVSVEVPDEPRYSLILRMWQNIAFEHWTLGQAMNYLNQTGLFDKLFIRQTISRLFSNKFYMGIIQSQKFGEAKGQHQPMISEEVFYLARARIEGRSPIPHTAQKVLRDELPLKGVLLCPHCNSILTGAPSTSRNGVRHFYYSCNERSKHKYFGINANKVNDAFFNLLGKVKVNEKAIQFFQELMTEVYEEEFSVLQESSRKVKKEIQVLEESLLTLKRKHLQGVYTDEEFLEMKKELNIELVTKRVVLNDKKMDSTDIQMILAWNKYYLTHLDEAWLKASLEGKRAIACSIFPEKLVFKEGRFIEPRLGPAYNLNELFGSYYNFEHPQAADYRTIMVSFQANYQQLHAYV